MLSFLFWPYCSWTNFLVTPLSYIIPKVENKKKKLHTFKLNKNYVKSSTNFRNKTCLFKATIISNFSRYKIWRECWKMDFFFCQDKPLALMINCQSMDQLYVLDWTPSEIDQRQFHKPLFQISWNSVNLLFKEREKEMKCDDCNRTSQSNQPSLRRNQYHQLSWSVKKWWILINLL